MFSCTFAHAKGPQETGDLAVGSSPKQTRHVLTGQIPPATTPGSWTTIV